MLVILQDSSSQYPETDVDFLGLGAAGGFSACEGDLQSEFASHKIVFSGVLWPTHGFGAKGVGQGGHSCDDIVPQVKPACALVLPGKEVLV